MEVPEESVIIQTVVATNNEWVVGFLRDNYGSNLIHVQKGSEAIKIVTENLAQLIICDIDLPDITGIQVAETLMLYEETQSTGVVLLAERPNVIDVKRVHGNIVAIISKDDQDGILSAVNGFRPGLAAKQGESVLIVDDEEALQKGFTSFLRRSGYKAVASSPQAARNIVKRRKIDICLIDMVLPGCSGLGLMAELMQLDQGLKVIIMSGYGTEEMSRLAIESGAVAFLYKPIDPDNLLECIQVSLKGHASPVVCKESEPAFSKIIGRSHHLNSIIELARLVARQETTVLITGESGTGKELFARAIHDTSQRKEGPFIAINMATLPETLIDSELFGYEKGAFTGADPSGKPGKFELANGGTIFLDEISEMPSSSQAKLLRVLQEKEVFRFGGRKPIKTDARIIAATNCDLKKAIELGKFRKDLYYRLSNFVLPIAPLRERPEDIPLMVEAFTRELSVQLSMSLKTFSTQTIRQMQRYPWPGNVRELKNLIEQIYICIPSSTVRPGHLGQLPWAWKESETSRINKVLEEVKGNKSAAAKKLNISRATLYRKLNKE